MHVILGVAYLQQKDIIVNHWICLQNVNNVFATNYWKSVVGWNTLIEIFILCISILNWIILNIDNLANEYLNQI